MVNIKINGIEYAVEEGTTILEACRQNGIRIPVNILFMALLLP